MRFLCGRVHWREQTKELGVVLGQKICRKGRALVEVVHGRREDAGARCRCGGSGTEQEQPCPGRERLSEGVHDGFPLGGGQAHAVVHLHPVSPSRRRHWKSVPPIAAVRSPGTAIGLLGTSAKPVGPNQRRQNMTLEERIRAELNPAQAEAVLVNDRPQLILAGAGSGKTRVLTWKIAWLVGGLDRKPWEIVALTFTNKAAREM